MFEEIVSIIKSDVFHYSSITPFNPPEIYPELNILKGIIVDPSNIVYWNIRETFKLLEYDRENYNTTKWNPLGWLINPGDKIFIKPNMIAEKHRQNNDWNYVITHGSVIRAVLDFVVIALKGVGRITIGDAPQTDSKFIEIVELMGLKEIRDFYSQLSDIEFEIINLQDEHWIDKDGIYLETVRLAGDPRGSVIVDLRKDSLFAELDKEGKTYYGAFYNINETNINHRNGKHQYAISKSAILADVFINIPKLKTHKKCGLTVNLKGLVGINANKNWLPHYVFGSPENGGDQFDRKNIKNKLENKIVKKAKQILINKTPFAQFIARKMKKVGYLIFGSTEETIRSGNWYGNDTIWRMALDLNRILMYANPDGSMRSGYSNRKKLFCLVDGIISMEGNGPVAGNKKETGLIIAGKNPVSVDATCAALMGFDWGKINLIKRTFNLDKFQITDFSYSDIKCKSNRPVFDVKLDKFRKDDLFHFKPHFGWTKHIEID